MTPPLVDDEVLRLRAIKQLKKRRDFGAHLLIYLLVNTALVVVWTTTSGGFFWPVFPIVFWGIGVVMNAWDVWHGDSFSEAQIAREIERQRPKQATREHMTR